jgi:alanine dehydrogenase
MIVGVMKEIKPSEYRVSAIPASVAELVRHGHEVYVEHDAGKGSGYEDEDYENVGAKIIDDPEVIWDKADMIYKVKEILPSEYKYLKKDQIIFTYIHSNAHRDQTEALLKSGCTSIAYEDIPDDNWEWPLLSPMSELAGKGGFLAALHLSQSINGGKGQLLANVCGVEAPVITIIGCGHSGRGACELAAAFGNQVYVLDIDYDLMQKTKASMPNNVSFLFSNRNNLVECIKKSDIVMNCILWPKTRKDHLINKEDLKLMKKNAIIVDIACDEGGAIETCRSTTHEDPTYVVDGITHYCVDNIPSAFSGTASITLANATLPYALNIADKGVEQALKDDWHLRRGLTTYDSKLTLEETAKKLDMPFTSPDDLIKEF